MARHLTSKERIRARDLTIEAALLALHHAPKVHYTQGARRWEGIAKNLRAWRGQYPKYADCSSFVTWCLWQGLGHFHMPDVVNGAGWKAGYTGTLLEHGQLVKPGREMRGDAVIYGRPGSDGEHTALVIGGGYVISHGSEGGPYKLPLRYRSDVMCVRRYILA